MSIEKKIVQLLFGYIIFVIKYERTEKGLANTIWLRANIRLST